MAPIGLPNCPLVPNPQQSSTPDTRTAHAWDPPTLTRDQVVSAPASVGCARLTKPPDCPTAVSPQQYNLKDCERAHVCSPPASTALQVNPPETIAGVFEADAVAVPS